MGKPEKRKEKRVIKDQGGREIPLDDPKVISSGIPKDQEPVGKVIERVQGKRDEIKKGAAIAKVFATIATILAVSTLCMSSILMVQEETWVLPSKSFSFTVPPQPQPKDVAELQGELESLNEEFDAIKALILDNPQKTITVALIQKDLAVIGKQQTNLAKRVDEIASLSKWFLIGTISMSLAILGLAGSLGYKILKPS